MADDARRTRLHRVRGFRWSRYVIETHTTSSWHKSSSVIILLLSREGVGPFCSTDLTGSASYVSPATTSQLSVRRLFKQTAFNHNITASRYNVSPFFLPFTFVHFPLIHSHISIQTPFHYHDTLLVAIDPIMAHSILVISRKTRLRAVIAISFAFFVAEISSTSWQIIPFRRHIDKCSWLLHSITCADSRCLPLCMRSLPKKTHTQ